MAVSTLRLEITNDATIKLVVSRRNLFALLDKLDNGVDGHESECTIEGHHIVIEGELCSGKSYFLKAESDAEHYGHQDRVNAPAGAMHPDTESRL